MDNGRGPIKNRKGLMPPKRTKKNIQEHSGTENDYYLPCYAIIMYVNSIGG